jgi:hypothetical protein
MASEKFAEIMSSVGRRMRAEFEETATASHHGGKGANREEIVRNFVRRYLPRQTEVTGRGEIISADGHVSPECDIMVVDATAPPLTDERDYRIMPAELVYGVVEVKSRLNGPALLDACQKIKAVKSVRKSAYAPPADGNQRLYSYYGQLHAYTPTAGLIFAFDSTSLERLSSQFIDWCTQTDGKLIPDGVWILDKGSLQWSEGAEIRPRPGPHSDLAVIKADPDQGNLLGLAMQLNALFAYAWLRPVDLRKYASPTTDETQTRKHVPLNFSG